MISISNCPVTGLERKVEYDFHWFTRSRQIIVKCTVDYYKDGVPVTGLQRIKPYTRDLVASDSLVNPQTGEILSPAQIEDYRVNKTALDAYQSAVAVYDSAMLIYANQLAAYEAAVIAYGEAMSASPQNPLNLPNPVPPIVPFASPVPSPMPEPGPAPIEEYDFYTMVLGVTPVILPDLLEQIILLRDSQGKFDI
jgi:hypothetical protein